MTAPAKTAVRPNTDAAGEYLRRGWCVVPIPRGEKGPRIPGWQNLRLAEADLPAYFGHGENVGIILGAASDGLLDIDLDAREALAVADCFLPGTGFVFGRASKPRSHRFYVCDPLPSPQKFVAPDGTTLIELRSNGQQTVVPPSLHPSGQHCEFTRDGEPGHADGNYLSRRVHMVAAGALLAHHWPVQGQRHEVTLPLAGMLLRGGFSEAETASFVEAVTTAAGDEETRGRVRDVISTAKRLAAGSTATGAPTLAQIIGDGVVTKVREWLALDSRVEFSERSSGFAASSPSWPEPLAPEAFHGLAGEIVRAIEPHSEADPAALLIQFLVGFGNIIGRGALFTVEQHDHHTNLFALLVGATAKARKGTSWFQVKNLFWRIEDAWVETRIHGGIGSGEGIIKQVRDAVVKGEKIVDEGESDKRLLLLESEFAQVLAVSKREGGTTSEVLRRAWDGTTLQTLTSSNPMRSVGAHVSLIGHITRDELLRHLDQTEIANGLINRFLIFCVRRSKALPDGGQVPAEQLSSMSEKLRAAIEFAHGSRELRRNPDAHFLWCKVYPNLSEGRPGLFGSVISRAEAQTLRLSMLYALLDQSPVIRREHLSAALAVWQFAEESALHVFGDALGDPVADQILRTVRSSPSGLTRTEVRDLFGRHRKEAEIERSVTVLLSFGLVSLRSEETGGRPVQRIVARHWSRDKSDLSD